MTSHPNIYELAQRMIDCFGAEAEQYAEVGPITKSVLFLIIPRALVLVAFS